MRVGAVSRRWTRALGLSLLLVLAPCGANSASPAAGDPPARPPESTEASPQPAGDLAVSPGGGGRDPLRGYIDRVVRPRVQGEALYRLVNTSVGVLAGLLLLLLILLVRLLQTSWKARDLAITHGEEVKGLQSRHMAEVRDMADVGRSKGVRQSTLFIRILDMFKADTKEAFFRTFGEAVLKGFTARQVAFYVYDRERRELYPKVYEMVHRKDLEGRPTSVCEESATAAVSRIRVRPGDGNLVGWCAANIKAVLRDQLQTDVTISHLKWQEPLKTVVACPILAKDPVTGEERFVAVIGLGETEDLQWTSQDAILLNAVATLTGVAFAKADLLELKAAELASHQELSAQEREQRKKMRSILDRIVAPHLAEKLLSSPEELHFKGEMVETTVFFSDIRGFTTYTESRPPHEVVEVLNEYLSAMTDVILEYGGTLDKFVGDAIVAFWGALPRRDDHAVAAVRAAFKMKSVLEELRTRWVAAGKEPFEMGMGLSTGPVLFGGIGSPKKLDFTCIGDTVNLGARLEALTRQYPYDLIISKNTYDRVSDIVDADYLGVVEVKGKLKSVEIYGVKLVDLGEQAAGGHGGAG